MKKRWNSYLGIIMTTVMILTGCSNSNQDNQIASQDNSQNSNSTDQGTLTSVVDIASSEVQVDKEFTANDLDVGYEDSTATHITFQGTNMEVTGEGAVSKEGTITINDKGSYVFTGELTDGQIIVDAEDTDKVHIILNGVSITCLDQAPIYIKNADKVFITLKEGGVNTLKDGDGGEYTQIDDNNVDGVIFSKADLTMNGSGTLKIEANYKHGIVSKDDLVITGGNYDITAANDALTGKDSVKIKDGTFLLKAVNGDGIESKNEDDTTKGYVYICGGNLTIESEEGIEGTIVLIEDGIIHIKSSDDGLNASSGSSTTVENQQEGFQGGQPGAMPKEMPGEKPNAMPKEMSGEGEQPNPMPNEMPGEKPNAMPNEMSGEQPNASDGAGTEGNKRFTNRGFGGGGEFANNTNCFIMITGGTITIDAAGDGIDSNGSISITGGTILVSGPTNNGNGALDYNGTAEISGGTAVIAGSSGMAQGFSDTSTQYSILYNFEAAVEALTEIKLTDTDGNVVASYTPTKQYQSVVISTPELIKGGTYTLTSGEQAAEITLSSMVTSYGSKGMGGFGRRQN